MEKARDRSLKIARYFCIAIAVALIGGATFAGLAYYDKFSKSGGFKTVNSAVTQNQRFFNRLGKRESPSTYIGKGC